MSKENNIVDYDNKEDKFRVNYIELIIPLIKSVQELKKENSTLKNNINNIKENYIELILPLVKSVQELKDENTVLKNKFNYYIKNNTI